MKKADTTRKYVTTKKYNKLVEQIERLQEQLDEANDTLIKSQNMKQPDRNNFVAQYLLKWGVK